MFPTRVVTLNSVFCSRTFHSFAPLVLLVVLLCCCSPPPSPVTSPEAPVDPEPSEDGGVSEPDLLRIRESAEPIYLFLEQGDRETADQIVDGVWELPRFGPFEQDEPSWTVDPFGEKYWRFIYYSLRHTRHLLAAYIESGDERYAVELREILLSYVADGVGQPPVRDEHTAAFASIMVTLITARLAEWGYFDQDEVELAYAAVVELNDFLLEPENFQPEYNHGITQAAALVFSGTLFDSEAAHSWQDVGLSRLKTVVEQNVDADGAQIEQSPFYHFYVLKFLWQILYWSHSADVELDPELESKIIAMVEFGKWFILPDGSLPMLGATQATDVRGTSDEELFRQIDAENPAFAWFRSAGEMGRAPETRSVLFETAGFSIMRSMEESRSGLDWLYEDDVTRQGHLVFDVGPYRTLHSDLDALSVYFHGSGVPVLVDSGLYSLEVSDHQAYFRSTRAHNTVVVGNQDQKTGRAIPRFGGEGGFWSYQSGEHTLFDDARHIRGALLIGANTLVVVDRVITRPRKPWAQVWNLPPNADELEIDDARLSFTIDGDVQVEGWFSGVDSFERVRGATDPIDGLYSAKYETLEEATTLYLRPESPQEVVVSVFRTSSRDENQIRDVQVSTSGADASLVIVPRVGDAVSVEISDFGGETERVVVRRGE